MMMEMDTFLKEFGRTLKTTRKQMGLSQVIAAQNMRIDYRHYQNIEGGKINLRLDTLMKLVKFYNLDKASRPFGLDSCVDLLSGYKNTNASDNWGSLHHHFVEGGYAGHAVVSCQTRTIQQVNEKIVRILGYRSAPDLVGRPIQHLLVQESTNQFDELIRHHVTDQVSKPFVLTFRTQPPAYPIPMMAIIKARKEVNGEEFLHCIFLDRRTLDEQGHRLKDILGGFQHVIEIYPQLRAV